MLASRSGPTGRNGTDPKEAGNDNDHTARVARRAEADRTDDGAHGAGRRRPTAARARVGQGGRTADPAHPRHFRKPPVLGQAIPEQAGQGVPAGGLRPARPRHVPGTLEPEHYTNAKLWADDVAAIIQQLGLERPVLVGWSYGGYIICDYLRAHGQDRIGAIDFAGGATKLGPAAFGTLIGPGFLDHFADFTADDLPTNIRGMRGLVAAFAATPLPADDIETLLCSAMTVPARIRANLGAREIDGYDVLRRLRVPLLVSQGRADTWCSRRWPSTSWPPARPPRPPGTRASATRRSWRTPSASTANWPRWPAASVLELDQ